MLTTAAGRFCYFNRPGSPGVNPTIMQQSTGFNFPGNRSAEPYITFTETNSTSYTWELFESSIAFPYSFTQIASGSGRPIESLTITYYGEITVGWWYYYKVTVTNGSGGLAELYASVIQNNPPS